MTFSAKQVAILLISAVTIAGVTFAVGYLSKGKQTTEKPPTAAKPNADTPAAAPGAITQKLDTDAILKERELEKSAAPGAQFTFQKTLMKDAAPAKESPPAAKPAPAEPAEVKPHPAEPAKKETKGPQAAATMDKRPAEPKAVEKKHPHDTQPATAKPTATPGKMFTIQVASFSLKTDADKLVARLESKRFMTNIQEFKDKADIWYRVRVGVYKTEQAANRDLAKVKAEGAPHAFVTGY